MKASELMITMPPRRTSSMFARRAAGLNETRTSGWSAGVLMSREEKWIWKPDTPASVPAGARISAGKSGRVARSFPARAVDSVNFVPVSCMPSPGVSGEADGDALDLFDGLLWAGILSHPSCLRT